MIADSKTSIVQFIETYRLQRPLTKGSIVQNVSAARSLEVWAGRTVYVSELTDDFVNRWIAAISTNGLSKATIFTQRGRLLCMWRMAHRLGLCQDEPKHIRSIKVPFKAPVAWSVNEVRRLLAATRSLQHPFHGGTVEDRRDFWSLAVRLAWDTALRFRDLTRLKKADFDADRIAVVTQNKTGRWHMVRIHESTHDLMCRVNPDDDLALRWDGRDCGFGKQFALIVKTAGLTGSWKKIRKSSATDVEIRVPGGGSVHLGHAVKSVAHTNYLDPRLLVFTQPMPTELILPLPDTAKTVGVELSLMQFIPIYTNDLNLTRQSILLYENSVSHLGRWTGRSVLCSELTEEMIGKFHGDILEEGKLCGQTIARRRICLTRLWNAYTAQMREQTEHQVEAPGGVS